MLRKVHSWRPLRTISIVLFTIASSECFAPSLPSILQANFRSTEKKLKGYQTALRAFRKVDSVGIESTSIENSKIPGQATSTRRSVLKQTSDIIPILSYLGSMTFHPHPSNAASMVEGNPSAEMIRKNASKIPGYGPPDILYPNYFIGKWKMTRIIVPANSNPEQQIMLEYPVRFLQRGSNMVKDENSNIPSNDGDSNIIADRSFNEMSLQKALNRKVSSTSWDPTNPNVLKTIYADGSSREIKVTKRSFSYEPTNNDQNMSSTPASSDAFFSSEYRRITDASPADENNNNIGGIPTITANRVLTKWKKVELDKQLQGDNTFVIEGIELIYMDEGAMGDPMGGGGRGLNLGGTAGSASSKIIMKSRLRLERISER